MEASTMFENLLQHIKESNLNFKLELSPFSAVILLKKSFIKDKFGNPLLLLSTSTAILSRVQEENLKLNKKILFLENANKTLKADYEDAVDDCEEAHTMKNKLENEIKNLKPVHPIIKEDNSDKDTELKRVKSKLEVMENELTEKIEIVEKNVEQIKNYKIEIKSLNTKNEKLNIEHKCHKSDKENLEKEVSKLSVALKSSKQENKEIVKKNDLERREFQKEIRNLSEYKFKHETEARELKKVQKKIQKKARKETIKVAEIEVKKMRAERESNEKESNDNPTEVLKNDPVEKEIFNCLHKPQCTIRGPYPPPHGPKTYKQSEVENIVLKIEAYETFTENVLEYMKNEPGDTLDTTIAKLEALKALLEPDNIGDEAKESQFDELIQMVKHTKEALEKINENDYDDDYYEEDDDLPRHYWGGEDGNELFFYEDDE